MLVVNTITELRQTLAAQRQAGRTIGLVPTMGCLHEGHLALVKRARSEADFTVVSIFVNPTQFGPNEDFSKYPRTFEADCEACDKASVDLIFAPSVEEFYPKNANTWVDVEKVTTSLCGAFRPGHFRGVSTVVAMLFNVIQPTCAVFGRKDLQQCVVIKQMVHDLHIPVKVIIDETVREPSGLAMSSRNRYLTPEELQKATAIPAACKVAQELVQKGETNPILIEKAAVKRLTQDASLRIQYLKVVHRETLSEVTKIIPGECALALACYLGNTRLIDNVDL
ncbi:MAG: pantoate--beta-alanine ligase [Verrucomicrobia bacterium]|jgi:pantoate--beta-alanine ligase|nr:pantoate--beta-alanine ligase [Verrucomicrobiota bacterium]